MACDIDLSDIRRKAEPAPLIDIDEPNKALQFDPMRRKLRVITK